MPFSIKTKLILLAALPVLLVTIVLYLTMSIKTQALVDDQTAQVRETMVGLKRSELKHYMDMTYSAIEHLHNNGGSFDQALPILKNLKYGDSGYIFGYRGNGDRVLLGQSDKGLGENFWSLQDKKGNYLVQDLMKVAKNGGGHSTYWFPKPGSSEPLAKTAYSIYLKNWDVALGTGFYFDDVDATIQSMEETAYDKLDEEMLIFGLVAIASLVITVILGYLLSMSIRKPLAEITSSIDSLAQGEADLTARLRVSDRFEMGELAARFNVFLESMLKLISEVKGVSASVEEGAKEISRQTSHVSGLIAEQNANTDQVATATTEMTAAASEISQNATQAAEAATTCSNEAQATNAIVSEALSEVNKLAEEIVYASDTVTSLGEDVSQINSLLSIIKSIAEQTNLLALNAAIEAARAGEHGRGFAVVADEVRALAGKTQQSTEEIGAMIVNLENGSQQAVNAMVGARDRGGAAVAKASEADSSLQTIGQSVLVIQQMNDQIASASEQQTNVCEEISEWLQRISDKANQTSATSKETDSSADQLMTRSGELITVVQRFRTN